MTVVIADTSPLNYLILIEAIDLLPRLYGRIIIPIEVLDELIDDGAPSQVSDWALKLPEWMEVRSAPLERPGPLSS
jgi:predicted nucleic acid-binding protein